MKKNLLSLVIFTISITLITNLYLSGYKVYAQESRSIDSPVSNERFLGLNLTAIDLSEEQAEKIEVLKSEFKAEGQDIREKLEKKGSEIGTLWKSYPPEAEKIIAKQKEKDSIQSELQEKTIVYRVKVIEILTEEQFKKTTSSSKRQPGIRPKQ